MTHGKTPDLDESTRQMPDPRRPGAKPQEDMENRPNDSSVTPEDARAKAPPGPSHAGIRNRCPGTPADAGRALASFTMMTKSRAAHGSIHKVMRFGRGRRAPAPTYQPARPPPSPSIPAVACSSAILPPIAPPGLGAR
jgi:hypothetical protein